MLGGYLGSGKTTLLNRVLAEASGRRIGVVVNDFGELGVDASLLEQQAEQHEAGSGEVPIVNLANGCVCCTLGDDLRATIQALAEVSPRLDHIVIEASGIADPLTAAAWGTVPGFMPGGVIVLAAADSVMRLARDRYVGGEVLRQLSGADLLVLTKTDLVDEAQLAQVGEWLVAHTDAPIIPAVHATSVAEIVLGVRSGDSKAAQPRGSGHPDVAPYVAWTTATDVVTEDRITGFVERLPVGVLRAKGFVAVASEADAIVWHLVQVVGRTATVTPWPGPARGAIEVIGLGGVLDVSSLELLADDYLRIR